MMATLIAIARTLLWIVRHTLSSNAKRPRATRNAAQGRAGSRPKGIPAAPIIPSPDVAQRCRSLRHLTCTRRLRQDAIAAKQIPKNNLPFPPPPYALDVTSEVTRAQSTG
jgi:hypothetical protein